jgi:alcohol dehydrogenase class IV
MLVRAYESSMIVSVGGGSTIDTAKGAAHLTNQRPSLPRVSYIHGSIHPVKPHVAIPTTAGPGAEGSPAMIYEVEEGRRVARVHQSLVPDEVIVIGELARTLPSALSVTCLLDGVAHSLEGLLALACTADARDKCSRSLQQFLSVVPQLGTAADDAALRKTAALASVLAAVGLRGTSVNVVHSVAAGLAAHLRAPHSVLVALSLVAFLDEKADACSAVLGTTLTKEQIQGLGDLKTVVKDAFDAFVLPHLAEYVTRPEMVAVANCVVEAKRDTRLLSGHVQLDDQHLRSVFANIARRTGALAS